MKSKLEKIVSVASPYLAAVALVVLAILCLNDSNAVSADTAQATFASPEEAGQALRTAAQNGDDRALAKILGADSKAILNLGDAAEDKAALKEFVSKFDQMNRWVKMTGGSEFLNIGADNYAFPIPLVQDSSSKWFFDTQAGADEILARRIGRNELLAIDAVFAIGNAEEMYAGSAHDGNPAGLYATRVVSTPGKQDGLFWQVSEGQPLSPLGRLNDIAPSAIASAASGAPVVIDGYVIRILTAQGAAAQGGEKSYLVNGPLSGGFAILATPVAYRDSGIMSFMMSREGVVYQADLGPNSKDLAAAITAYNPAADWEPVK